ncbi:hypothetical protein CHLRE_12g536800v5 [Chlamydomonas reinhardtii]|uniref:Uncharacterized protein n=1 Tax=Chlamydomonas reinhardtii TaxID=3055 RepID=A8IVH2_CHLRE|nr:uncharacterized protein CHLRE_12g536800v5 [Chlamydomonas reinhardtii]PNW75685.1 hypothetical protein CHLRE_12g536800v5 [Chlamydomonas reinhardtii]|eukprot:XP_001692875.1 predicted protein [Chlamydomonas reinhardtii]
MMLAKQAPCTRLATSSRSACTVPVRALGARPSARRALQPAKAVDSPPGPLDSIATKTIEDLDTDYCDDFVCTSSPAVEQTVRSLARELQRGRYAAATLYQPGVTYSDGFRTFTGVEGYKRQRWVIDNVEKFKTSILRLRMLDKGTSEISWQVDGSLGGQPVSLLFTTTCEHNLVTGRITNHRESWNLSRCSPPAAAMATANRYAWSAKQAVEDAKEGLTKAAEKLGGGGGADMNNLPSDPTRFYQNGGGGGQNQDLFAIGFLIALLYLAFKLFGALETLG